MADIFREDTTWAAHGTGQTGATSSVISDQHAVCVEIFKFGDFLQTLPETRNISSTRKTFAKATACVTFANTTLASKGGTGDIRSLLRGVDYFKTAFSGDMIDRIVGTVENVQAAKNMNAAAGTFSVKMKAHGAPSAMSTVSTMTIGGYEGGPTGGVGGERLSDLFSSEYAHHTPPAYSLVDEGDFVVISVWNGADQLEDGEDITVKSWLPFSTRVGHGWKTLMIGRIDSVDVAVASGSGGEPAYDLSISGRDAQGVFQDTPLYFNPYDPATNNANGRIMAQVLQAAGTIGGTPGEVISLVLSLSGDSKAMLGYPPLLPNHGVIEGPYLLFSPESADDLLDSGFRHDVFPFWYGLDSTHVYKTFGYIHAWDLTQVGEYTPLWQLAQRYQNPEYNEMWIDTKPPSPLPYTGRGLGEDADVDETVSHDRRLFLHFREKPFVNLHEAEESPWFRLAAWPVWTPYIRSISAHRGGNRVNHIHVTMQLPPTLNHAAAMMFPPIYCPASVERYGMKRKVVDTPLFTDAVSGTVGTGIETLGEYRDKYAQWQFLAPYYWEGDIDLAGVMAQFRPGTKIVVPDWERVAFADNAPFAPQIETHTATVEDADSGELFTAYVHAVAWSWSSGINPSVSTKLSYSRGYIEKNRLPDIRTQSELWTSVENTRTWGTAGESQTGDAVEWAGDGGINTVPTDEPPEDGLA